MRGENLKGNSTPTHSHTHGPSLPAVFRSGRMGSPFPLERGSRSQGEAPALKEESTAKDSFHCCRRSTRNETQTDPKAPAYVSRQQLELYFEGIKSGSGFHLSPPPPLKLDTNMEPRSVHSPFAAAGDSLLGSKALQLQTGCEAHGASLL